MRHLKRLLPGLLILLVVVGCTTTRKRGESSKLGKVYHDITSKYNRNFNANVLIDETLASLEMQHRDDYSQILPLYPLNNVADPTQLYEPMDQAIEKVSVAISIHRPSHWTDDNYLIIGKAQYLKQDYESAEATFRYLIKHYDPQNMISASSQRQRDADQKLNEREERIEEKQAEKERKEKIKERKKEIADRKKQKKANKRRKKAHKRKVQERRAQIKAREKSDRKKPVPQEVKPDVAKEEKGDRKDRKKPFSDNPKLPKIKGDPASYFLKHKPAIQSAKLWLARTLIERDRYGEAENILRALEADTRTFDEIRDEIYVLQAYSSLDRGQTAAAVDPLRKAIDRAKRSEHKARYAFILAQILEQTGQYTSALEAYDNVIKMRPAYEMHFNAQLSKIKMQWNSGKIDDRKFANLLERMIKDDKNNEYQDQLYFALAERDLKAGDISAALANLSKAVRNSAGNQIQQTESYYKMANLFYNAEDYVRAKYYFDSTLMVMNEEDIRYEEVSSFVKNLSQIAANLEIINLQDSLLRLSRLTEKELKAMAAEMKKKKLAAQFAAQNSSSRSVSDNRTATITQVARTGSVASATGSIFFAYDDRTLKKGQRDFTRTWGDIPLADNWRRSSGLFGVASSGDQIDDEGLVSGPISETEIDEIFKDVPKTETEREILETKIEDALFELGRLYRSEIENNEKSIEALERLLDLNPATEHLLDAYYLLYVSHTEEGHIDQANLYRDKILTEFEDSEYAKYINDPSYLRDAVTEEEKVEQYYQEVHRLYDAGQFKDAYSRLREAPDRIGTSHMLLSKFSLLSAMCIGHLQGREQYVNALKDLIAKYPNTEEEQKAKEIIRLLGIRFTETNQGIEEINPDTYFELGPSDNLHMILVALKESDGATQNNARIRISDFNKKYHKLDRLNVATIVLSGETQIPIVVIRRFDDREGAMKYYDSVQKNINDFVEDPTSYEIFAASQRNYRKIIQLKSIDLYREYFVKEYLSK